jgi:hypothetical protein
MSKSNSGGQTLQSLDSFILRSVVMIRGLENPRGFGEGYGG